MSQSRTFVKTACFIYFFPDRAVNCFKPYLFTLSPDGSETPLKIKACSDAFATPIIWLRFSLFAAVRFARLFFVFLSCLRSSTRQRAKPSPTPSARRDPVLPRAQQAETRLVDQARAASSPSRARNERVTHGLSQVRPHEDRHHPQLL